MYVYIFVLVVNNYFLAINQLESAGCVVLVCMYICLQVCMIVCMYVYMYVYQILAHI